MKTLHLTQEQVQSAKAIQQAIDSLGQTGGKVVLPDMHLALDRGIELRSNVTLTGQGDATVLSMAPARVYPFNGYHNYGMLDVPLQDTTGLEPGMTVSMRDDRHGGFFETFARITWVEDGWIGLDTGIHSDYHADLNPVLMTSFPLIYGQDIENAGVEHITLDGNRLAQPAVIGACRGSAVYFLRSHNVRMRGIHERNFAGEGIGFQMCTEFHLHGCTADGNGGNGFHPGAGSTAVIFSDCSAADNDRSGFFFCVRANHVTVQGCRFEHNHDCGISVGTRDNFNLITGCEIVDNDGPGVLFRENPEPVAVKQVCVQDCRIGGNSGAQILVKDAAHHLVFTGNTITGPGCGIDMAEQVHDVYIADNAFEDCDVSVCASKKALIIPPIPVAWGYDTTTQRDKRHLGVK